MLILDRHVGEIIDIGNDIEIVVKSIRGHSVKLAIKAPFGTKVNRREITERIRSEEKPRRHTTTKTKERSEI